MSLRASYEYNAETRTAVFYAQYETDKEPRPILRLYELAPTEAALVNDAIRLAEKLAVVATLSYATGQVTELVDSMRSKTQ